MASPLAPGVKKPRDVAVVLAGGGVNGVFLEVGFLKRLSESPALWERIGYIVGTSSGAVTGFMAALDRVEDLERFVLGLQPGDIFVPRELWEIPFYGFHEFVLPQTVASRLDDPVVLARALRDLERELVVIVTDIDMREETRHRNPLRLFELAYSSKTTPPDLLAKAIFASAAISGFGLSVPIGDEVGTDGGWVRNWPLTYAYDRPGVNAIIGFSCVSAAPTVTSTAMRRLLERLERFQWLPLVRRVMGELAAALARGERGEPTDLLDLYQRLASITVMRNVMREDLLADEKDQSIRALRALRDDVLALIRREFPHDARREELIAEVERRFVQANFPFRRDRLIEPRITVRASPDDDVHLEIGIRRHRRWSLREKIALIDRGWALTDAELRRHGLA